MTAFDPIAYKTTTCAQWQDAAKAWNDWGGLLRTWLGPATDAMLDMAGVAQGDRVLDVAAGAGDQSLLAAERVEGRMVPSFGYQIGHTAKNPAGGAIRIV